MNKTELKEHLPRLGKHFIKKLKQEGLFNQFLTNQGKGLQTDKFTKMIDSAIRHGEEELSQRHISQPNEYDLITCVLNAMLRKYVESQMGVHPERIMKMGQDIFNSFCIETFGEEKYRQDMEAFHKAKPLGNMAHGMPRQLNPNELKQMYNHLTSHGMFNGSFREFIEHMMLEMRRHDQEDSEMANEVEDVRLPF